MLALSAVLLPWAVLASVEPRDKAQQGWGGCSTARPSQEAVPGKVFEDDWVHLLQLRSSGALTAGKATTQQRAEALAEVGRQNPDHHGPHDIELRWHAALEIAAWVAATAAVLVLALWAFHEPPPAPGTPQRTLREEVSKAAKLPSPIRLISTPLRAPSLQGLDVDIPALFATAAAAEPQKVALVSECEDTGEMLSVTYAELQKKVLALAVELLSRDTTGSQGSDMVPGQLVVAVCVRRSPALVVALLGILEAGGAYCPLEPSHPESRRQFALENSGAALLVTESDETWTGHLPEEASVKLRWPAGDVCTRPGGASAPKPASVAQRAAYLIFTSGSTGTPKGVMVPRRSVVNVLRHFEREVRQDSGNKKDVLVSVATCCFDISVLEIFWPLCFGFRLVLASGATASSGSQLARCLSEQRATLFQATPASFKMLLKAGWQGVDGLRVLCGGEAFPASLATELPRLCPGGVWNVYGPTETTIWSTSHQLLPGEGSADGGFVPIGGPISGTVLLLSQTEAEQQEEEAGELLIGGDGVTFGYNRRPELNADRFVTLSSVPGFDPLRVYRTGDLVRQVEGRQELKYLGRIDCQVKVRGFRIELGEVECALESHPAVHSAVVETVEEDEEKELVAFVQLKSGSGGKRSALELELQEFLASSLPSYMVPRRIFFPESFPLSPSKKVDRKVLRAQAKKQGPIKRANDPMEEAVDSLGFSRLLRREEVEEQEVVYRCYTIWMLGIISGHWFLGFGPVSNQADSPPWPLWLSMILQAWCSEANDIGLMICMAFLDARGPKGRTPQLIFGGRDLILALTYMGLGIVAHFMAMTPDWYFFGQQSRAWATGGWHGFVGDTRWFLQAVLVARIIIWIYQLPSRAGLHLPSAFLVVTLVYLANRFASDHLNLCGHANLPVTVKKWYTELFMVDGFTWFCPFWMPDKFWFAIYYVASYFFSRPTTEFVKKLVKDRFDGPAACVTALAANIILGVLCIVNLPFVALLEVRNASPVYAADTIWWRKWSQLLAGAVLTGLLAFAMSGLRVSAKWWGTSIFAAYVTHPLIPMHGWQLALAHSHIPLPLSLLIIVTVCFGYMTAVAPVFMALLRLLQSPFKRDG